MKRVEHRDEYGRLSLVGLPDDALDSDAPMGIPLGPPSLDALGLPMDVQTRLHNELYYRGLYNVKDIRHRAQDVEGALKAALRVDAEAIKRAYIE